MTTVAVTGGAGYIGAMLVPMLLARGHQIRVLDLFVYGRTALSPRDGLTLLDGDVRDPEAVARCVAGTEAVVHLAAIANDPSCDLAPDLAESTNVAGSRTVVDAARAAGARRIVFVSSASVYGIAGGEPVDETTPTDPITQYGVTKCRAEEHLRAVADERFRAVSVRPAALCGYSPRLRLDLTVNLFTAQALAAGRVTVFGGEQRRPVLHVTDAARLCAELVDRPWPWSGFEAFNAVRDNLTVSEIADRVTQLVNKRYGDGRAVREFAATPPADRRSYTIDARKVSRMFGFAPRLSLEHGVHDLCDAFDRGLVPDPLVDDRYYNVRRLKRLSDPPPDAAQGTTD
ncbi:NAD-dependent epimerase/dehydratase family protein [Micromonospora sp. CPCC 206061]|uniref:NAD-dependent epimerase/dehydratase family protein n=1 Tax=Micromonospora sp. CPCC 206061 TaxID=3122410 RepID=UPI002FF16DA2